MTIPRMRKQYPEWVRKRCDSCELEVGGRCRRALVTADWNGKFPYADYVSVKLSGGQYQVACSHYIPAQEQLT